MHKRTVNQAIIELTISPVGPLLIKASDQGADPTKPDMEFVETYHNGDRNVYLPGSSLKGAIRAHCERIVRTLSGNVTTCDPTKPKTKCKDLSEKNSAALYNKTCTVCQIFGSTKISAHACIADAYPVKAAELRLEERNGVAIDRIYGSAVRGALFNFQVLTAGTFTTKLNIKNFTTAQLGLIALVIRDFDQQRVSLGFAKSRGLGQVNMKVNSVEIHYPTAVVEDNQVRPIGSQTDPFSDNVVVGAGQLVDDAEAYGFPNPDSVNVNVQAQPDDYGFGATLSFEESDDMIALWRGCVGSWSDMVRRK